MYEHKNLRGRTYTYTYYDHVEPERKTRSPRHVYEAIKDQTTCVDDHKTEDEDST